MSLIGSLKKLKLKKITRGISKVVGSVTKAVPIVGSAVDVIGDLTKGRSKVQIVKPPNNGDGGIIGRSISRAAEARFNAVPSSAPLGNAFKGNNLMYLLGGGALLYFLMRKR